MSPLIPILLLLSGSSLVVLSLSAKKKGTLSTVGVRSLLIAGILVLMLSIAMSGIAAAEV